MPLAKQRRSLSVFDTRSVMLFAALTVGGSLAQAQTPQQPSAPKFQVGPSARQPTLGPSGTDSAFDRADANQDGALSSAEAEQFPAIASRFHALDKDRNGALSRAEFDAGARQP